MNLSGDPVIYEETVINGNLTIPEEKPLMERLLGYKIEYEINKAKVIDTPMVTDDVPPKRIRKVIIEGEAKITIKYVALVEEQQVHGAHFYIPFSSLIMWPGGPAPGTPLCVGVLEEHVQIHRLDNEHLSKVIVIQLDVSINQEGDEN